MCGISGIFDPSGRPLLDSLKVMSAAITHRGPDSDGFWSDASAGIGFAHRRLAIVDLSKAGAQPMESTNHRYIICYNGEIYNHLDIRHNLQSQFGELQWRGHSDTETLLVAIELQGLETTVRQLVGMFAFALWDRETQELSIVRDRIGEKPLYYGWVNGQFLFASELTAIEAASDSSMKISLDALTLYFQHLYVPAPYSIFEGISKLEAGSILTLHRPTSQVNVGRYWSAIDIASEQRNASSDYDFDEACLEVERLLTQSIKEQMIADVPVGAFLSGGIDSTLVVALMQKHATGRVNTFTIGFDDANYNEAEHAKKIAAHLGTNHTELYLSDTDIEGIIKTLPDITDEPFADSSLIPTFAVSKLARESVTVSLSGDGGDELFGGYTRYPSAVKAISLRHRVGTTGRKIAKLIVNSPLVRHAPNGQLRWNKHWQEKLPAQEKCLLALQLLAPDTDALTYRQLITYCHGEHSPMLNPTSPESYFTNHEYWLDEATTQEAVQMLDVLTYLPDDILAKVDRAAMCNSLETRVPMLDHRLISYIWSLPTEMRAKTTGQETTPKPLLKSIASRHVPLELIERPKKGFGIPIGAWLRGPLKEWAQDLIHSNSIDRDGLLDSQFVIEYWNDFLLGKHSDEKLVWSILMFQQWMQQR